MSKNRNEYVHYLNAAYEAIRIDDLHNSVMKIYNSMPDLFDKYSAAVPLSQFNSIKERSVSKNMSDITKVSGVYIAVASRDKLCNDDLFCAIERTFEKLVAPISKLVLPSSPIEVMMPELRCAIEETGQTVLSKLSCNLLFYAALKKERPHSKNRAADIVMENIWHNLSDLSIGNGSESTKKDIIDCSIENDYYDVYINAVKAVFIENYESLMSRATYMAATFRSYHELGLAYQAAESTRNKISYSMLSADNTSKKDKIIKDTLEKSNSLDSHLDLDYATTDLVSEYFDCGENDAEITLLYELVKAIYQFQIKGIDITFMAERSQCRKTKNLMHIAKESYLSVQPDDEGILSFDEKHAIISEFIKQFFTQVLLEERTDIIKSGAKAEKSKSTKPTAKNKNAANANMLSMLANTEKENKALREENKNLLKKQKQQEKLYLAEIHDLEDIIKKTQSETEPDDIVDKPNDSDISNDTEQNNNESDITNAPIMTDDEFRAFLNDYNIMFWGLRPNLKKRLQEMFPEMDYIDSDKELTNIMLNNYDGVFIKADFTCHSKYYRLKNMTRNLGIPFICLDENWMSTVHLFREAVKLKIALKKKEK